MEIFNAGGQFIGSQMLKTTKKTTKKTRPLIWIWIQDSLYLCFQNVKGLLKYVFCHNHRNVIIALILQYVFADFINHKIDSFLFNRKWNYIFDLPSWDRWNLSCGWSIILIHGLSSFLIHEILKLQNQGPCK